LRNDIGRTVDGPCAKANDAEKSACYTTKLLFSFPPLPLASTLLMRAYSPVKNIVCLCIVTLSPTHPPWQLETVLKTLEKHEQTKARLAAQVASLKAVSSVLGQNSAALVRHRKAVCYVTALVCLFTVSCILSTGLSSRFSQTARKSTIAGSFRMNIRGALMPCRASKPFSRQRPSLYAFVAL